MTRQYKQRFDQRNAPSLQVIPQNQNKNLLVPAVKNAVTECGWGRLIFGQTFSDPETISQEILKEKKNQRDIALYLRDPHVVLSLKPQELFLDPSHTYRLWLSNYLPGRIQPSGFLIRKSQRRSDADAINRILKKCNLLPADPEFMWENRDSAQLTYIVAEDPKTGEILGTVTGIDHVAAFSDPENGSSLWCLAVDPQASFPGIGRTLVAYLADHFSARGRVYLDLSVMHDNSEAISLYESMGFRRMPIFCIKNKNSINEQLFIGEQQKNHLNPYGRIIVNEALRRGIAVDVIDAEQGYFELTSGGRSIVCRESLSELTTAIAMSRCDNKMVTSRLLGDAGVNVPAQVIATDIDDNESFLATHKKIVVKPLDAEQGLGITVGVEDSNELQQAINLAEKYGSNVILEQYVKGHDLRVIVIDYKVVAAAVRKPAMVRGNGQKSILELIGKQSRRRAALTDGESKIPLDGETERCINKQGYKLSDILPKGKTLQVRETANLHTGGTIHDVTDKLHPELIKAAEKAARTLDIPVVGLDLLVPDVHKKNYVIIEANERPGLANHEPQPTAERFIDFLFPQTRRV